MGSPPLIFARSGAAVLILALSILATCNDKIVVAPPDVDPGGLLTAVDVPFCGGEGTTRWVAFQDGDGAWTMATPILDGPPAVYRHSFGANIRPTNGVFSTSSTRNGTFTP